MAIFMNMERKLRNGGRKAPIITREQFVALLNAAFSVDLDLEGMDPGFYGKFTSWPALADYESKGVALNTTELKIIRMGLNGSAISELPVWEKVVEDFQKVNVSLENFQVVELVTGTNGILAALCAFGGDWEHPMAGYIYHDGKNFRGYIPTFGNAFNAWGCVALGSEMEMGGTPYGRKYCFLREEETPCEMFSDDGTLNSKVEVGIPTVLTLSEAEYNAIHWRDIAINFDACLEDFSTRVVAEGSLVGGQKAIDKLVRKIEKYGGYPEGDG